jgi:hypothetical protein
MKAKKWLAGGVLSLAAAFSFAALYKPEKIEVRGTLAEVGSVSNELKEVGLRKPDGSVVKFNVASLGLVAGGNIDLQKTAIYRAESQESLLDEAVDAVIKGKGDFGDWQYKASTFGLAPQTRDAITSMPGMDRDSMPGMDMTKPVPPEHHHN